MNALLDHPSHHVVECERDGCRTCLECGLVAGITRTDTQRVEDELRTTPSRTVFRPGITVGFCEAGHQTKLRDDPGPRPL